jgi:flagellar L-ring protein precursor FlgH
MNYQEMEVMRDYLPARFRFPKRTLLYVRAILLAASLIAVPLHAAQISKLTQKIIKPAQPTSLDLYLQRARSNVPVFAPTFGSLWNPDASLADLASDNKAHRLGDIITIQLAESTTSALQQSAQTQRTFSASSGISAFLGLIGAKSPANNLFSPTSAQNLNGKGQTALATSISTSLAGNVVEVLPNGLMVIQATRDVNVTNQRQTIVLRGIVRRSDITPANTVSSTAVSQLEVELVGKGVITEGTHPTNTVVKILLRILGF